MHRQHVRDFYIRIYLLVGQSWWDWFDLPNDHMFRYDASGISMPEYRDSFPDYIEFNNENKSRFTDKFVEEIVNGII